MCPPVRRPVPTADTRTPEQVAKDAAEYQAYANAVESDASANGGIGAGGVYDYEAGKRDYTTDAQKKLMAAQAAGKAQISAPGYVETPDTATAILKSRTRSALLQQRLSSTGRKGAFGFGDVTAGPNSSVLGGM